MLFLLFHLGRERYAVDAKEVAEVLPVVRIKTIPHAPTGVAGAFNYHGKPVPVIDLSSMALGSSAPVRLSTRLILVHYHTDSEAHLLGFIAEKSTETLRRERGDFVSIGVRTDGAPYLGPVATDDRGIVQWVHPQQLLTNEVREALFTQPLEY